MTPSPDVPSFGSRVGGAAGASPAVPADFAASAASAHADALCPSFPRLYCLLRERLALHGDESRTFVVCFSSSGDHR